MPKIPFSSMAQYVVRNPFTTAASIFTPFFAKNEDRGYFRTALITTPIIFATGAAVPKLFGGVRDFAIQSARTATDAADILKMEKWQRHEQPIMANLKSLFQNPGKGPSAVDQATSAYLIAERRGHRDFLKEQRVLTKLFNRRFTKTTDLLAKSAAGELGAQLRIAEIERLQKGELLTNALHVARRSSLTPTEWAQGALGEEAKILNQDEMLAMFNEYSSRPEFVKTLRNRLRELNRLDYEGTLKSWGSVPRTSATTRVPLDWDLAWNDPSRAAFEEQAPEAYKFFEQAKRAGRIRGIELELSKDVVSGKTGRVLSISVERKEGQHL